MTIIGFSFSRIHAEHKKPQQKGTKIATSIKIDDVNRTDLSFDKGKAALKADFTYTVSYGDSAQILLGGQVLMMLEDKAVESIIAEWKNKKILPKTVSQVLISHIMQRSIIEAITLSKDIGLQPPIPLPKLSVQAPEKKSVKK